MRVTPALAGGGLACGLALGTGVVVVPCWFRALTGVGCPFCGGSRAVGDLLRGDVLGALGHNAFAVGVLAPLLAVVLVALARWETGRASRWWPAGGVGKALVAGLIVLTTAWWVFRGLPAGEWFRST
ncbi:hypothetical protein BJF85_19535 [Saccharomonospora sp. CUA-673]|uniref:DUF2752 domain-containing protein n=1 Tax=Saccharomonospora sp. CUA-673 TaxID=1904969 RepID=UPI00095AEDD2|nr:DUF2752 domain-containing protein [Saccharomonospora sp. CUA-673]OLT44886.1 hypothetical protein BJF85_19535 [Saccharomonospora sp. CUA-673]